MRSLEARAGLLASAWHDGLTCRAGRSWQARRPSTPEPAQSAQLAHRNVEHPGSIPSSRLATGFRSRSSEPAANRSSA